MNQLIAQSRTLARVIMIGLFFSGKYQDQAQANGVSRAAKNLRKQGVPVEVAAYILAYRVPA